MEKKNSSGRKRRHHHAAPRHASPWAPIMFLSALAILLAIAAGLFLRQSLQKTHTIQYVTEEKLELSEEKAVLLQKLNELEKAYQDLSASHASLKEDVENQKEEIRRLRRQIHTEGSRQALEEYDRQILELTLRLNDYQEKIAVLEESNRALSGENLQVKSALTQAVSERTALQQEMLTMEEQMRRAAKLTIHSVWVTPLRETWRGDRETTRARRTDKLQVCFTIQENTLASPGEHAFFFRIMDPEGNLLKPATGVSFQHGTEEMEATFREDIRFMNVAKPACVDVAVFGNLSRGSWRIEIYTEESAVFYGAFELN